MLDAGLAGRHFGAMDIRDQQIANLRETNDELRERIRQLEGLLVDGWTPPSALILTSREQDILALMMKKDFVSREDLETWIWTARGLEMPDSIFRLIPVLISNLRAKLHVFGIRIRTRYNIGWRIVEEDKQRLRQRDLKPQPTPQKMKAIETAPPKLVKRAGKRRRPRSPTGYGKWSSV